jgi:hypothetical protein
MKARVERKMNPRRWQLFLEEVRRTPIGRAFDFSGVSDLNELAMSLQRSADLSESRSKREVEELLRTFEEKLQRAA